MLALESDAEAVVLPSRLQQQKCHPQSAEQGIWCDNKLDVKERVQSQRIFTFSLR